MALDDQSSTAVSNLTELDFNSPAAADEEDEEECRVCRGAVEEGRPLFKPCVCSGSIGFVHQDCLESWLKIQRRDGSCELCKVKFRFAPQYAENTPLRLPFWHIVTSLCKRAIARWLPFTLRSLFAASLWLIVAPLVTAYLYHGWMARPSALLERTKLNLIVTDLVSGAVVAAVIIVSFLSLMSFADFLRGEWQQRGLGPRVRAGQDQNQINNNPNRNNRNNNNVMNNSIHDNFNNERDESQVDNGIWELVQKQVLQQPNRVPSPRLRKLISLERESKDINSKEERDRFNDLAEDVIDSFTQNQRNQGETEKFDYEHDDWSNNSSTDSSNNDGEDHDFLIGEVELNHLMETAGREDGRNQQVDVEEANFVPMIPQAPDDNLRPALEMNLRQERDRGRNNMPGGLDFDPDEAIDMDINIALDELLGVRGPLHVVVRNLLWLLAFNAVFLGFFAFVPRTVGVAISSILLNTTLTSSHNFTGNTTEEIMNHFNISQSFNILNAWKAIDAESIHQNSTLRLHDLTTVAVGYLSLALAVIFFRYLLVISQKVPFLQQRLDRTGNPAAEDIRDAVDEVNRLVQGLGHDIPNIGEDPQVIAISMALGVALDAMLAVVKVGVLLFLKMFLLPIIIGVTLDASTIPLFGGTVEMRVSYAGKDLFSFILLHWVAGITFMLLVTVSVLQLREVVHPELLAQVIRPQEPQPDLLGNLMHESVSTHAKRMVLSLLIYAFLLTIHIYIPGRLYEYVFGADAPYFKLQFAYILTPQLQVPLELLFFHLCMLALLEKYKNAIGGIQHHWLKHVLVFLGLSGAMLPQTVEMFQLIGSRDVFESKSTVDPFWFELAKPEQEAIPVLELNVSTFVLNVDEKQSVGETKESGERVLRLNCDFIRLPVRLPGRSFRARGILLPTRVGKYRLCADYSTVESPVIQLWEEVHGISISRPPEGWDDLGAGGADVQGRWAWGTEKKSTIEVGIASRLPFFHSKQNAGASTIVGMKLVALCAISWIASTTALYIFLATPLLVGRSLHYVLRIPDKWIHDPMAFCVGFMLIFPLIRKIARFIVRNDTTVWRRGLEWIRRCRPPPIAKTVVLMQTLTLWFVIAPFLLGIIYEMFFMNPADWIVSNVSNLKGSTSSLCWTLGTLLLYGWSDLCILGIMTREFGFVGNGQDARANNNNADAEAAAWLDIGGGRLRLAWQGKHGRVARFWDTLFCIFSDWEWDKVDQVVLLQHVALPVLAQLFWCASVPLLLMNILVRCLPTSSEMIISLVVRSSILLFCSVQLGRVWKDQLQRWFEAAHNAARDERYLIGEILLNYDEQNKKSSEG